jgi:hypothetical protein
MEAPTDGPGARGRWWSVGRAAGQGGGGADPRGRLPRGVPDLHHIPGVGRGVGVELPLLQAAADAGGRAAPGRRGNRGAQWADGRRLVRARNGLRLSRTGDWGRPGGDG